MTDLQREKSTPILTLDAVKELTLIYDGECGFCRSWVDWARKRDAHQKMEFIPCQSTELHQRFPQITETDCLKAMYAVLPDGRFFSGADAAPHVLRLLPKWQWCAALFEIPGIMWIARPVYRLIARNRRCLSRSPPACRF